MFRTISIIATVLISGCASPDDRAALMVDIPQNCGVSQMVRADSGYIKFGLFQAEIGRQMNYQCIE